MFSSKPLYRELISIIDDRAGSYLSKMKDGRSSIAKAETDISKLKYPFVTIDRLTTINSASYTTNRRFDPTDNTVVVETYKDITFIIQLRSQDSEAYDVADHIRNAFSLETALDSLLENAQATVKFTTDVDKIPDPLSTTYQRIHTFNVTLSVKHSEKEDVGYIENINVSGEVDGEPIDIGTTP